MDFERCLGLFSFMLSMEMQRVSRFKTLSALITALVLVGLSPVRAAETAKKPTTDRIVTPTKIKPLDINSGSIDELKALPGIDDVYAQKIVDGRPYQKKDELVSRRIIPEVIFNKLKDRIITVPGTKS
jgi:competence protein ComEA